MRISSQFIQTCLAFAIIVLPARAGDTPNIPEGSYQDLIKEGIKLFRAKDYEQALSKFRAAVESAQPDSMDQLAALENLALPLSELRRDSEVWKVQRQAALIRYKLQGSNIPENLDGNTPEEAIENKLKKQVLAASSNRKNQNAFVEAERELLQFYQKNHETKKADEAFALLAKPLGSHDSRMVALQNEWAEWCRAEGLNEQAVIHQRLAASIENEIANAAKERAVQKKKLEDAEVEKRNLLAVQKKKSEAEVVRTNLAKRSLRIENAELWYQTVTRIPVSEPEIDNGTLVARYLQSNIDYATSTKRLINAALNLRKVIDQGGASREIVRSKALYVNSISGLGRSLNNLLRFAEKTYADGNFWIAQYVVQIAYRGYYLTVDDKGDEVFEKMYSIFTKSKKAEEEEEKSEAAKYR